MTKFLTEEERIARDVVFRLIEGHAAWLISAKGKYAHVNAQVADWLPRLTPYERHCLQFVTADLINCRHDLLELYQCPSIQSLKKPWQK